jgi:hypothetical protein
MTPTPANRLKVLPFIVTDASAVLQPAAPEVGVTTADPSTGLVTAPDADEVIGVTVVALAADGRSLTPVDAGVEDTVVVLAALYLTANPLADVLGVIVTEPAETMTIRVALDVRVDWAVKAESARLPANASADREDWADNDDAAPSTVRTPVAPVIGWIVSEATTKCVDAPDAETDGLTVVVPALP